MTENEMPPPPRGSVGGGLQISLRMSGSELLKEGTLARGK